MNHSFQINQLVKHPSDNAAFTVVGIRADSVEVVGDFSGGTHNVSQKDWVNPSVLIPYRDFISLEDIFRNYTHPYQPYTTALKYGYSKEEVIEYFDREESGLPRGVMAAWIRGWEQQENG